MTQPVVVLVSGGLDSMVCAAIARERGQGIVALTIDYDQRHRVELDAAARVAALVGAVDHVILPLSLRQFGGSALTDEAIAVPRDGSGIDGDAIPPTYVPARNIIFLSLALGLAEARGAGAIYVGVNALDYSGYPDCRPEFIDAFVRMARVGTQAGVEGRGIAIETPLIAMTKADIALEAARLGLDAGVSWTCYDPVASVGAVKMLHCGVCDACRLRARGFAEAGLPDPTAYAVRP